MSESAPKVVQHVPEKESEAEPDWVRIVRETIQETIQKTIHETLNSSFCKLDESLDGLKSDVEDLRDFYREKHKPYKR